MELTTAQAVLAARAEIGKSNDTYLQSGLMLLWTGDANHDAEYTIYPASLPGAGRLPSERAVEQRVVEPLVGAELWRRKAFSAALAQKDEHNLTLLVLKVVMLK